MPEAGALTLLRQSASPVWLAQPRAWFARGIYAKGKLDKWQAIRRLTREFWTRKGEAFRAPALV